MERPSLSIACMIPNERSVHASPAFVALACASLLLAGCAADATVEAPTTAESPQSTAAAAQSASPRPLETLATRTVHGAASCSPLTCCFPAGGGWEDDPFEDALKRLGCTTPANYTEATGSSNWWVYTRCPASLELAKVVWEYSNVAPYDARFIDNLCLELGAIGSGHPDSIFVEFDPTCETCVAAD
jgi:hypothetical protein